MEWISQNLAVIASLGITLYEVIARKKTTKKDVSILSNILKVVSVVLPNNKAGGGVH
jgi:hypothetical protein